MKLVKSRVESLAVPEVGQTFAWDSELRGFGVRVTAAGARSYIAQGRVGGKTRRVTIGPHGRWTCDEARKQAREILRGMDLGVDPKVEAQRKQAEGTTLRQVVTAYLSDRKLKPNSQADINKHLRTSFAAWAERPAASITREDCLRRFRDLTARGPAQANQAFVILRALLNYARATYRAPDGTPTLPENPVAVLSEAKLWNKERARETRIPLPRVGSVWFRLQSLRDEVRTRDEKTCIDYVSFLLMTGCRGSEAAELTWDRVDLASEVPSWHLPDPKNGRAVTFPLPTAMAEMLRARLSFQQEFTQEDEGRPPSRFVFGSWGKCGHITDARGVLEKLEKAAGVHLTRHDLRRTFIAMALHRGHEMWKAELLTGHVPQSVTLKHYTETSDLRYLAQETESIGRWVTSEASIVEAATLGRNVVPMRA
jgi:integrase